MSKSSLFTILMFVSIVSNGQNISVTFSGTGAATQIDSVTATNLRTNQSVTFPGNEMLILTFNAGIQSLSELTNWGIVFPNPFSGQSTFTTIVQNPQMVYLKVQNLVGQVVAQTNTFIQTGENEFALSVTTAGIYIVSITTEQGTASFKVICTEATESENRIQYNGSASGSDRNPLSSGLKSSQPGFSLGYTIGDIILYRCKSGIHSTIMTDSPTSSKNCEVEFVPCTDPDGKNYSIVKIGGQTWMGENLAWLPAVSPTAAGSYVDPYYYVYGYEGTDPGDAKANDNYATYGVLYNWPAALAACPWGWHLPTDDEWKVLEMNQGMTNADADAFIWRNSGTVGGKLKEAGTSHWYNPNTGATNSSGFTALPGGHSSIGGGFWDLGYGTSFWSASEGYAGSWNRGLGNYNGGVFRYMDYRGFGESIRCLIGVPLTVTTISVTSITQNTASSGGNIISNGGADITANGVCWSTTAKPTTADSKTTDEIGTETFISSLTGLAASTSYYVRAYATNSVGTGYGDQVQFNTGGIVTGTFTDTRDNHVYKTVEIGTQTWMAENLAWLPAVNPSSSGSDPYYYVYGYEGATVSEAKASTNFGTYGVLYNWPAALTACPSGWHLPSDEEWKVLEKNQGMSQSDADATGWRYSGNVGGKFKEAGTSHWKSPNTGATNSSGFTALPGGYRIDFVHFSNLGGTADFWSASEDDSDALGRFLSCNNVGIDRNNYSREFGFSARCIKD